MAFDELDEEEILDEELDREKDDEELEDGGILEVDLGLDPEEEEI